MTESEVLKQFEDTVLRLYLSYVNDFLTVEVFAEYYNLSESTAIKTIEIGRKLNNN